MPLGKIYHWCPNNCGKSVVYSNWEYRCERCNTAFARNKIKKCNALDNRYRQAITVSTLLLFYLSSCALKDNFPAQNNYSSTVTTIPNQTQAQSNYTNSTPPPPPPKPVLLPVEDKMAIYVMDTTVKGTSIITLNNKSILINSQGGVDGLRTLKTLKNLGISKLDHIIVTNQDEDNMKGIPQILLRIAPKDFIHSGIPSSSSTYKLYTSLIKSNITIVPHDSVFSFDEAIVSLIVPYDDGSVFTDDDSVEVKVDYGGVSFLFMTDCGTDCESRIVNSDVKSKVIISNGGCNSLSTAFLLESSPEMVVFSGTPCTETLERIKSIDVPYLSTSTDGDVLLTSDGKSYESTHLKTK